MTPNELKEYVFTYIEPKVQEVSTNYLICVENKQFLFSYSGNLVDIAYILGQVMQDFLSHVENDKEKKEAILNAYTEGLMDKFGGSDEEEY